MNLTNGEVPLGLGMALAQNTPALEFFGGLNHAQQQQVIEHCGHVHSKAEMRKCVSALGRHDLSAALHIPQ